MPLLFLSSDIYTWIVLPLIIFIARVCDVTVGTLRILFVAQGKKLLTPLIGFFQALIWLLVMGQIFQHLDNYVCYFAYAGGFAVGNFVGIYIESKLALGLEVVRIITQKSAGELINELKSEGYGITIIDGEGATGPVKIIYTLIKRKELPHIVKLIHTYNPKAFFSVEDVRMTEKGVFPVTNLKTRNVLSIKD